MCIRDRFKIDPSKGRFAFENPPEKYLDAYTGIKDNKGRDIYLVNPLFRYIGDYFSWIKILSVLFLIKCTRFLKPLWNY